MKLITEVNAGKWYKELNPGDSILLLGSCFTTGIGQRLADDKFDVCSNPLGTLYNPASIACCLRLILSFPGAPRETMAAVTDSIFSHEGIWSSWYASSLLSAETAEGCRKNVESALVEAARIMENSKALIITFGNSHVWYRADRENLAVANCHKMPDPYFLQRELTTEEIVKLYSPLIREITAAHPAINVIFTVSPYRYLKYGLHDSALGKARLLLAADALVRAFPEKCAYFPSFEIMNDELRSYRFYEPDMLHPTAQAADIIYSRFAAFAFSPAAEAFRASWRGIRETLAHRPVFSSSEAYHSLILRTRAAALKLGEAYPAVDITKELSYTDKILSTL